MIERQLSMNLSEYASLYDTIISNDHLLRKSTNSTIFPLYMMK